jgi:hypothetical protein
VGIHIYGPFLRESANLNRSGLTRLTTPRGLARDKTFTDKASGKDVKRPQLEAMQSFVREDRFGPEDNR